MNPTTYSYSQKVKENHLDELDHVNNVVYVQWIQDAAVKHWHSVAPKEVQDKYIWVIVRHEIDYKKSAKLHDELQVETHVISAGGVVSDRMVQIFNKESMQLLVESKTTWCMLETATLKPARITDEVKALFLPHDKE